MVAVVVIAARELDKHARFVADRPGIMAGRQKHYVVL